MPYYFTMEHKNHLGMQMDKPTTLPARPAKTFRFTFVMDETEQSELVRLATRLDRVASDAVRYAIRRTLAELEAEGAN